MISVTDFQLGDVYQLKDSSISGILLQVGKGGDMGVFRSDFPEALESQAPEFRVLMNQPDVKRRWKRLGNFAIQTSLSQFAWYGDDDIGCDQKYRVQLSNIDHRIMIDSGSFEGLERLAVWETVHVLDRLGIET